MRKLAIFTAAFVLAAAGYVYNLVGIWALWIAGGMIVLSAAARVVQLKRASIFCLGAAVALLWCLCYQQLWLGEVFLYDGSEQQVQVRLTDLPDKTGYGAAVDCSWEGFDAVLYADEALLDATVGDTVSCRVRVAAQADDLYHRSHGTVLSLYAKSELEITPGRASLPQRLRLWLQERIDRLYDGEAAALVKALLTGDRSDLSYETFNAFSVVGISHAVAVSGMHISILIAMVSLMCGYEPRLTAILGTPAVILFALMTGASASVCRAAVMQIMLLLAPVVRRERDNATTLSAAALVLLVQNPWCIASVSFQLSFAAVAGLMLFSSPMQKKLLPKNKKPGRLRRFVASGISATLSATLLTLPLTIFYFEAISIVAPAVNLLVLWAVTGVFSLGFVSCLLGPAVAWIVGILSQYILFSAKHLSQLPFAAAYPQNFLLMFWAVAAYFLAAAALLVKRVPVRGLVCAMTALFLVSVLSAHVRFVRGPWQLTMLDVGQGQCLVLRIGEFTTLIDCGGSDPQDAGETAARYLHSVGVTHVDAMILTHYDDDHAGGAEQFLGRVEVDTVYLPSIGSDCEVASTIAAAAEDVQYVSSLTEILVPGGSLTLLPPVFAENDNNAGVCVLATAEKYDILVTGDIDAMAELRLMSRWVLPDVELLVAGHHGAATSGCEPFLNVVLPETVAISVGADNTYGHPHEETLQRFAELGAAVYRTDLSGTLHFYP